MSTQITPPVESIASILAATPATADQTIKVPLFATISSDLLTPVSAYLKLTGGAKAPFSFLFESVAGGEKIGRFSLLGTAPNDVVRIGGKDPLRVVEERLNKVVLAKVAGAHGVTGGAVGYIAYDCVRFFEPKSVRQDIVMKDPLAIPDSIFMFADCIVVFDHLYQKIQILSHFNCSQPPATLTPAQINAEYSRAKSEILAVIRLLTSQDTPLPPQKPITSLNAEAVSNTGQARYESFVTDLKEYIKSGDVIQAVPSQRVTKRTDLHPFNAYRKLRSLNPSPYMFYMDLDDFQLVGASPEMLVKVQDGVVYTHPIAGTRKRGATQEMDDALAQDLLSDMKERSEHVMLVDLGRNDVNRICDPTTVNVDSLMHIERYSHVMHIVSHVSGTLRKGKTMYDAFRSIFPAGTVSGAPKIRAMQIISELEAEKRGIYAGSVGYFSYNNDLDTCIAIRSMIFKDGNVHCQAGAGIVYDSVPVTEWEETVSKLRGNVKAIEDAEREYLELQQQQ
ncbi:anthranilate synthase component I [Obelidium mucronatum]|nr:anthranilate synthase component I [Obelidium mucronatum]